jgi:hypothetical protein
MGIIKQVSSAAQKAIHITVFFLINLFTGAARVPFFMTIFLFTAAVAKAIHHSFYFENTPFIMSNG